MTIFEKIIKKDITSKIIYEDEKVIAVLDIAPITIGHTLVIPKVFSRNMKDITNDSLCDLMMKTKQIANKLIDKLGVDGYKICINNEKSSGQEVFYTHVHIIPTKTDKEIEFEKLKLI